MSWERMTIDEYAAFERAVGSKVVKTNGVWWRETKPCFFRPLNIFTEIQPESRYYPQGFRIGGVQHGVSSLIQSNCNLNLFVFDDLQGYSLESMNHTKRARIKKGLKNFIVKPIDDLNDLIKSGHQIYLSFYNRTHYSFQKKRKTEKGFEGWARAVFGFPKIFFLGAYRSGKLCALSTSLWVEDIVIHVTFFSTTESLHLNVADAIIHTLREKAINNPEIKYIYLGMSSGRKGIDEFKYQRGCRLLSLPAYYQISPLILTYMKYFNKDQYQRLLGRNIE